MKELFIDCSKGLAGDMLSAALLELFPDRNVMLQRLNEIGIPGVEYSIESVERYGITGSHLTVRYLGQEERDNPTGEHKHGNHHRGVQDVFAVIESLKLTAAVREDVKAIYTLIAKAEAEVHGCEMENIHFHELGTMDAVADICAACYLLNELAPEEISASPLCTGFGSVKCAHGIMPVPAPATAVLLVGMQSFAGDVEGELCTPTGTAIIKYFAQCYSWGPMMSVTAIGRGMGNKDFGQLSCVQVSLGESEENIVELCCNVDDMSPEAVGFAIDELLRAGAADVYYEPIGMKKNRPGLLLVCLCRESLRDKMVSLIFKHTSTIGIRETLCRRYVLKREERIITTPYGDARVKISEGYGVERRKVEYEDLARFARENNLPLSAVQQAINVFNI